MRLPRRVVSWLLLAVLLLRVRKLLRDGWRGYVLAGKCLVSETAEEREREALSISCLGLITI